MKMERYANILTRRPDLVLLAVGLASACCMISSFLLKPMPDFTDPTIGFEARGTSIGQRLTAWRNLIEETSPSGQLVANPKELLHPSQLDAQLTLRNGRKNTNIKLEHKIRKIKKNETRSSNRVVHLPEAALDEEEGPFGRNVSGPSNSGKWKDQREKWKDLRKPKPPVDRADRGPVADGFFCESPNKEYGHIVVTRTKNGLNESLFTAKNLRALCELEQELISFPEYEKICQRVISSVKECCRPWSLANYVTLLANKSSCFEIDEDDVQNARQLLTLCFPFYRDMKLGNECEQSRCRAPAECTQHNAAYNILHYLTDTNFIVANESTEFLRATMIFLPIARSTKSLPYFHQLEKKLLILSFEEKNKVWMFHGALSWSQITDFLENYGWINESLLVTSFSLQNLLGNIKRSLSNELVAVAAMDLGLKNALFDEFLISDCWLVALGGLFVLVSMWLYTSSLIVTIFVVIAVMLSLGIAYFVYMLIFSMKFFPFMNLLAVVVVVGIGADDAFIFMKIWKCVASDRVKSSGVPLAQSTASFTSELTHTEHLAIIMSNTMRHASLSMLVSSVTTASAFFGSYVSPITAVRCFGIFAGTAVLANYLLMVTWLPAAVALVERSKCTGERKWKRWRSSFKSFTRFARKIEDGIIVLVVDYPAAWIILFGLVGIFSGVVVFYWPQLQLPDSPNFKLFSGNHPFEIYDARYKDMFWFEKVYTSSESFKLPLRFVWGIKPIDKGDYLDPTSRGDLYLDRSLNVSSPASQKWLLKFCQDLKQQVFVQMSFGLLLPNCFIENFITWMGRRCLDEMSGIDRTPCCENSTFPFEEDIFDQCLPESISSLYETPREFFMPGVAGPKFSRNITVVSNATIYSSVLAVVVEYESTQVYSMSYTEINQFVETVQSWTDEIMKSAPPGMKDGWFISDLDFFDLQDTLSYGTLLSIGVSMVVSLCILLLVTLNILISIYAIITVAFTIFTTVGILVLLNWRLNVLESVAVCTAIGLAIDFSLHYGVHYRLSHEPDRTSSARFSLHRMIEPTLFAASTTILAGALMLPSNVLAYIQIGLFLVVVMTVSWLYATFFLMSLLSLAGPEHGCGQFEFRTPSNGRGKEKLGGNVCANNRVVHHQSIVSASSSAIGELVTSESHELDSLTSSSIVRPISADFARPLSFDRGYKKKYSYPREKSPSTGSAVTVLPDDNDLRA